MAGFPTNLPPVAGGDPSAMPMPQGTPTPTQIMAPGGPPPQGPPPSPQSMGGDLQQMLLMFLAGMGFPHFEATINKLRKGPNDQKGIKKDAANSPQQMNPMMAMMLAKAAQARGGMPGGMVPPPQGLPPIG